MKKACKISIICICSLLILLSLLIGGSVVYISAFARKNVDAVNDERLFSLAKGTSYTEYYVDASGRAVTKEEYVPKLKESIALGEVRKEWVALNDVDKRLIDAFISAEDRKFYTHSGVNLPRTLYALANSVFHFKSTFGASTITQQVIKNISGDNEVTLKRKLSEIIRAYNIEKNHSKDEILELYLNIVPMGENIYGVYTASKTYFGKSPGELSVAESAALAGITNAPTRYNPHTNYENCLKKRNEVLYAMLDFGTINEAEYEVAKAEELAVLPYANPTEKVNSWFTETVNSDVVNALMQKYSLTKSASELLLYNGGLKIYTTESETVQGKLEKYFSDTSNFPKEINGGLEFSMVVCDSVTGNLLGIVGAAGEKRENKILNFALAPNTPGSSLKPLALYAPLINSGRINWATVFDDVPLEFIKNGETYTEYPKNYPKVYDGLITVKDSLRLSKNTTAIRLYNMLGATNIYNSLKNDFLFDTLIRREITDEGKIITDLAPSPLALGQLSYGVSLRKLTEAYTVFARDGSFSEGRSFIAVYDSSGNTLIDNSNEQKQVFSPECARVMNKLLMNVTESGTASKITLKNTVDTAGKTGTSGDDKDRLFIGYTPYLTAGIWCGYNNGDRSIGKIAPTHIKIWDDVMTQIHSELLKNVTDSKIKNFSSEGLVRMEYCKDSGKRYGDACSHDPRGNRSDVGYFIKNSIPYGKCNRHVLCDYDVVGEGIASSDCPDENIKAVALLRIEDRHFPKEIIISDADYVYRDIDGSKPICEDSAYPYYYNYIEDGDYVGRGRHKKQFNALCSCKNENFSESDMEIAENQREISRFGRKRRQTA